MSRGWRDKRVLITGHTGFKGTWLALYLDALGARVYGLALDPPTKPSMFDIVDAARVLAGDHRLDVRHADAVRRLVCQVRPEVVFHLAAQPLVRDSYADPVATYAVNVLGTVHLLDALRTNDSVRAAVIVTTDKCYENRESNVPFCESDRLGGRDAYSSSKACAELAAAAYRASFFSGVGSARIATARAGNVIGGGDWAADRLIPDCVRAYVNGRAIRLRFPNAVRPWQHVLEPVAGYVLLGERLLASDGEAYACAWNFGPSLADCQSVSAVAAQFCEAFDVPIELPAAPPAVHEAGLLRLDSTAACARLRWHPRWPLARTLAETMVWYRRWLDRNDMLAVTRGQIAAFHATAPLLVGERMP